MILLNLKYIYIIDNILYVCAFTFLEVTSWSTRVSGGEGRGRAGADASTGTVMMDHTSSKEKRNQKRSFMICDNFVVLKRPLLNYLVHMKSRNHIRLHTNDSFTL